MSSSVLVAAAAIGLVLALVIRARAESTDPWQSVLQEDDLDINEMNRKGIGLIHDKLQNLTNGQLCQNKVKNSCCKATGNSISELTETIKETQAQTQLQMEVLLLAVSTTMESVRTLTGLVRDHFVKDISRHGKDGRKRGSNRNELTVPDCNIKRGCKRLGGHCMKESQYCGGTSFVGKQYCSRRSCKCCVTAKDISDYVKNNGLSIYTSKRRNRNKGNKIDKISANIKTKGKTIGKGSSYPPRNIEPITTNKKDKIPTKAKDELNNKENENRDSLKEDSEESKTEKYKVLSESHTALLPPKSDCNISKTGISEEEKIEILKLHNDLRSQIALGQEQRGAPGPQSEGANLRELVWNDELAEIAQGWASQCPSDHDCKSCRKMITRDYEVGQNIFEQWTNSFKPAQVWASAVNGWYNEVKDLPNDYVKAFQPLPPSGAKIGHYTQLAWAETNEVGCGAIIFHTFVQGRQAPASKKYVCNYGPAGNYLDTEIYTIGPAASQCTDGISDTYPALCI